MLSWRKWKKARSEAGQTPSPEAVEAARDALSRAMDATPWAWPSGSRPFFWRWPLDYEESIMAGIKLWLFGKLKPWTKPQRLTKDPISRKLVLEKLKDIREKGYVKAGNCEVTDCFLRGEER